MGGFKVGEILRVWNGDGCALSEGEYVVVVPAHKYPTKYRELVKETGLNNANAFVCVEPATHPNCSGFYIAPRFRRAERERV